MTLPMEKSSEMRSLTSEVDRLAAMKRSPRKLCPVCQQERRRAAIVRVELRRSHPEGRGAGEMIDGKQLSICEDCAAGVWPQIRRLLPL